MLNKITKIVQTEWKAQDIVLNTHVTGPKIEILFQTSGYLTPSYETNSESHFLIMQGSFDPPTVTHFELLKKAVELKKNINPSEPIDILLLLSLSHVDKRMNVLERSLLGYRIEMFELLLKQITKTTLNIPIALGLSNVARYIDLIPGVMKKFHNSKSITFIMGIDVFKKVLDQKYYTRPLSTVIPQIFQANYFIAGRKEITIENEFITFLKDRVSDLESVIDKVFFISMPEHSRFLSATLLRKKIAKEGINKEANLHPVILNYLKKHSLYSSSEEELAILVTIQTVVRLGLEAKKEFSFTLEILNQLLSQIKHSSSLQKKIIDEYIHEDNNTITRRWAELLNQSLY
ncbi:MAG: hypothetical protein ACFE8U_01260 [Candidatus Hermodarchaeota archaeon]